MLPRLLICVKMCRPCQVPVPGRALPAGGGFQIFLPGLKIEWALYRTLRTCNGRMDTSLGANRSSIFRLIVGVALARRGDRPLPPTWGIGSEPGPLLADLEADGATTVALQASIYTPPPELYPGTPKP